MPISMSNNNYVIYFCLLFNFEESCSLVIVKLNTSMMRVLSFCNFFYDAHKINWSKLKYNNDIKGGERMLLIN
jgi:uncharacterized protein involved in cysteine biosynthesis